MFRFSNFHCCRRQLARIVSDGSLGPPTEVCPGCKGKDFCNLNHGTLMVTEKRINLNSVQEVVPILLKSKCIDLCITYLREYESSSTSLLAPCLSWDEKTPISLQDFLLMKSILKEVGIVRSSLKCDYEGMDYNLDPTPRGLPNLYHHPSAIMFARSVMDSPLTETDFHSTGASISDTFLAIDKQRSNCRLVNGCSKTL